MLTTLRALATWWPITVSAALPLDVYAQGSPAGGSAAPPPAASSTEAPPNAHDSHNSTETPAVVVNGNMAQGLLGKPVLSLKGEALGRIVDVVVDRAGMMRAAIIDFGGFLGVGTRKIAVDWNILHFPPDGSMDKLIADLPRNQLQAAPVFKEGEPIVIMGAASPAPNGSAPAQPSASAPAVPAQTPPEANSAAPQH